jgi:hypothetical protein
MALYHFTDPSNIPSIRQYGLLSWFQLLRRGIKHIPASNDTSRSLDQRKNLEDYVRLCLQPAHPMAEAVLRYGRIRQLSWLQIADAVLDFPGTLFSSDNATSNRAIIDNNLYTAIYSSSPQAEVLIRSHIPFEYIIFPNENVNNNPFMGFDDNLPF